MALFWSKKSKSEKIYDKASEPAKKASASAAKGKPVKAMKTAAPVATKQIVATTPVGSFGAAASAIIRPHITEKSGMLSQSGVYTFQISPEATKATVAKAVIALYKVTPAKIAVLNHPAKSVIVRGRRGMIPGFRKAVVTVKKGEKIDFV